MNGSPRSAVVTATSALLFLGAFVAVMASRFDVVGWLAMALACLAIGFVSGRRSTGGARGPDAAGVPGAP